MDGPVVPKKAFCEIIPVIATMASSMQPTCGNLKKLKEWKKNAIKIGGELLERKVQINPQMIENKRRWQTSTGVLHRLVWGICYSQGLLNLKSIVHVSAKQGGTLMHPAPFKAKVPVVRCWSPRPRTWNSSRGPWWNMQPRLKCFRTSRECFHFKSYIVYIFCSHIICINIGKYTMLHV